MQSLAPEFPPALRWENTDRPVTLQGLRGQVVLVDFWTHCCINCLHALEILHALEERYAGRPLTIVGVHSGKFDAEKDPRAVRQAMQRLNVHHPVLLDPEMVAFQRFGVRSWPTLVVLRPNGTIAAFAEGEADLDALDACVGTLLAEAEAHGSLGAPVALGVLPREEASRVLRFPGKAVTLPDGRLVISDSGHDRVLLCSPSGVVEHAVGGGAKGFLDGPFAAAMFDDPQGLAWHQGSIFVADRRNHALRRIDLDTCTVHTVAGQGVLGNAHPLEPVPAREIALRSPWDLVSDGDALFVAMAGSHQVWRFWPASEEIVRVAGSGMESLQDGPMLDASFAQPSALAHRDGLLYVADSESSAIRTVDLTGGDVRTLVGQGLFAFGDRDGDATRARLAHPRGIAVTADAVLIADTYNGKIKRLARGAVETAVAGLSEPGSIHVAADGAWLIADTNAHRVVRFAGRQLSEIAVTGAPLPGGLKRIELGVIRALGPGAAEIALHFESAAGGELTEGSPLDLWAMVTTGSDLLQLPVPHRSISGGGSRSVLLAVEVSDGLPRGALAEVTLLVNYVSCRPESGACVPARVSLRLPVALEPGGASSLSARVVLPPAADDGQHPAAKGSATSLAMA